MMLWLPSKCESCLSVVPVSPKFPPGVVARIQGHTVTDSCPNCGGILRVPDGTYYANHYTVNYSTDLEYKPISTEPDDESYGGYLQRLADDFESALSTIEAEHNFEYGEEFEIALCGVLRRALPNGFGICRGYVVDSYGATEGDDIIIYDKQRFPRLRPGAEDDFSRKQRIPIEAVYAYIEAKYTLALSGQDGQSLSKALHQVARVKSLISTREKMSRRAINRYVTLGIDADLKLDPDWPDIRNPPFVGILARRVRLKKGKDIINPDNVVKMIAEERNLIPSPHEISVSPDYMVAGQDCIFLPFRAEGESIEYVSPFLVEGATLRPVKVEGSGFALGLVSLLCALDWIALGRAPFEKLIATEITGTSDTTQ